MTICPECGQVGHIRIPEDEIHCGCSGGWVWFKSRELGCGLSFRACGCPCHAAGHPADRSPDDIQHVARQIEEEAPTCQVCGAPEGEAHGESQSPEAPYAWSNTCN